MKRASGSRRVEKQWVCKILYRNCVTIVFHASHQYPPSVCRKNEVLGQEQGAEILPPEWSREGKTRAKTRCWIERGIYSCSVAAETWSFGKASCRHGHNFCTVTWIYTAWVRFLALTFKVHYFAGHRKKKFEVSLGIPQSLAFVTPLGTSLSRLNIPRCRRHWGWLWGSMVTEVGWSSKCVVLGFFTFGVSHIHLKWSWSEFISFTEISFCTIWVVGGIIPASPNLIPTS